MIPRLIAIEKINDLNVWFTDQNTYGISFYLNSIDLELDDIAYIERQLAGFLRNIDMSLNVRIKTHIFDDSTVFNDFSRSDDLRELTQTQKKISIHIEELPLSIFGEIKKLFQADNISKENLAKTFINKMRLDFLEAFSPLAWTADDITNYFHTINKESILLNDVGITVGNKFYAVLKLTDLAKYHLHTPTLGYVLQSLSQPFEMCLTMSKIDKLKMNFILNQKSTQEKTATGLVSDEKYRESEESIRDLELYGNEYFRMEMHFITYGIDQKELLRRMDQAQNSLNAIGEFNHEIIGCFSSYASTLIGAKAHFGNYSRLIEKDSNMSCYMPLFFQGSKVSFIHKNRRGVDLNKSVLAYHRNDGSVDFFNIYDESNASYSCFVIGQPGKGKSVLTNQMIRALLHNKKTSVVVLDVKGSYKRVCQFLNGTLYEVDWNKSAFINPLSFLTHKKVVENANSIEIIYQLIQSLVLNKGETELSSKDEIELKQFIKSYLKKHPKHPSIDDFANHAKGFRTEELNRWTIGGIYEHVFSSNQEDISQARDVNKNFKYYNIQDIAQASNSTLSSVLMSSIMAEVLMHFLIKETDDQFVFIVDEAPFFIKHCFESFKFLVKNVRKMNGSLFIVVQKSTDLKVNGQSDLISDIPNKIIFTSDGTKENFQSEMSFTDHEMEMIDNLVTENRKYAKFFLKDNFGSRTASIVLSPKEYWRSTTLPPDLAIIEKISAIYPKADFEILNEFIVGLEEYR